MTSLKSFLESLGSGDIARLMHSVTSHAALLEASLADIRRGGTTGYLLDFDLLYSYLFDRPSRLARVAELDYLFEHAEGRLFLGTGTLFELEQKFETGMHLNLSRVSESTVDYDTLRTGASWLDFERLDTQLDAILTKEPDKVLAIGKLRSLIEDGRVSHVEQVIKARASEVSSEVFEETFRLLQRIRRGLGWSNLADAFNISQVVALRTLSATDPTVPYGFYLSHTRTLLDARFTKSLSKVAPLKKSDSELVRVPLTALHSERVRRLGDTPAIAEQKANDLLVSAKIFEAQLRSAPGYNHDNVPGTPISEWEQLVAGGLSKTARDQVDLLEHFVGDTLVLEIQQLLDRAELDDWQDLRARATKQASSPQQLFDLIAGIARAMPIDSERFPELWRRLIKPRYARAESISTHTFGGDGIANVYLEVECHPRPFWVVRWPTDLAPETLLSLFNGAFSVHDERTVLVGVGAGAELHKFEADLPIRFGDLVEEVSPNPITWIRVEGSGFTLYGDVLASATSRPAVVGLISECPTVDHVAGLYSASANRFLFRSWIRSMLRDAGVPEG